MPDTTTIKISRETWRELNHRKRGPGDTFDDVVQRLLAAEEDGDDGGSASGNRGEGNGGPADEAAGEAAE
jgi:predicted CopG family antitoxin